MKPISFCIAFLIILVSSCNSSNKGANKHHSEKYHKTHATEEHNKSNHHMHKSSFEDLAARFESEERSAWQKPEMVIKKLGEIKGKKIADIGAGTGYFSFRLAEKGALVTAIDVDKRFIEFMDKKKAEKGTKNLQTQLVGYDNPELAKNQFDIVLIVDTYHHFDDKESYLTHCFHGLKEDGTFMNVDFKYKETKHGPPLDHRIAAKQVKKTMLAVGFSEIQIDSTTLTEQYIITGKKKV